MMKFRNMAQSYSFNKVGLYSTFNSFSYSTSWNEQLPDSDSWTDRTVITGNYNEIIQSIMDIWW